MFSPYHSALCYFAKRTVLFSFATTFLFTSATRHLLTLACVRSGGLMISGTVHGQRMPGRAMGIDVRLTPPVLFTRVSITVSMCRRRVWIDKSDGTLGRAEILQDHFLETLEVDRIPPSPLTSSSRENVITGRFMRASYDDLHSSPSSLWRSKLASCFSSSALESWRRIEGHCYPPRRLCQARFLP